MRDHEVLIVGGGPTGLMLAGELTLAGVDVGVLERRIDRDLAGSRAGGMTPRTLEVTDQRGIVDRFLSEGVVGQNAHYSGIFFDVSDLPTRHNYGLALLQYRTESILADWVTELGSTIHYGCEATDFIQDAQHVEVSVATGEKFCATYLVGCDGGRSQVRKAAGVAFPGWDASTSCLVADAELTETPPWGLHRDPAFHSFFTFDGEDTIRIMVTEPTTANTGEPTLEDLRSALHTARGTDYGLRSAAWISRFTDSTRQASSYRDRRVLLAGDAAHIHFPIGGQGLNTGIQDAVNLGWKLGQVVKGISDANLLDTYHAERHPVAAGVLHNTMAQSVLNGPGPRVEALRDTMAELLTLGTPRQRIAAMMCGLDIRYDLGQEHPLMGRRVPDLDLHTADGPTRLYTLLHDARALLLVFGQPINVDMARWTHRVTAVDAQAADAWTIPVIGEITAPAALLVRPDGYVAWTGDHRGIGLHEALNRWFT
ncbi:FAD-dependent monooxygenase [Mycolicibacterium aubagnense]|uniref:Oxygenase n=1 Tax=Mycolicibacterium aubagnense TaxID=319707 RepID=A0ABM7IFS1_9MYCO|nr:FAD-dependent monooxygenase [Mycolicibacterium aubagnense]TLH70696.1 hypothetical protein C1S80_00025 [Mycolicibacterium aubagnense]WGI32804.1 FAD-dependent monooxygenase [Mycolicibacterium aubagnense]BBX85536.1 putative oxygenase [Mycolicibacterium aubagnense]